MVDRFLQIPKLNIGVNLIYTVVYPRFASIELKTFNGFFFEKFQFIGKGKIWRGQDSSVGNRHRTPIPIIYTLYLNIVLNISTFVYSSMSLVPRLKYIK